MKRHMFSEYNPAQLSRLIEAIDTGQLANRYGRIVVSACQITYDEHAQPVRVYMEWYQ